MLLGPALVIFIGWMVMQAKGSQSITLLALGIVWGVCSSISLQRSRIILRAEQLDIQIGFPWKRSLIIPLNEITQITFYQPALGTMLNFGKIILVHQGKRNFGFRFIPRSADLIKAVQEAISALPCPEQPQTEGTS
ncbi:MAG: hypothetical protein C0407_05705 [Desulfobacca sp.]|nr:hypothetical protein [Desulfobacca sp.]